MSVQERTRHQAESIGPVSGKFASTSPEEFRREMEGQLKTVKAISDTVSEQVEQNLISPTQGASVVAHVTGSLLGWSEFYRELRTSDLALSLIGNRNGQ